MTLADDSVPISGSGFRPHRDPSPDSSPNRGPGLPSSSERLHVRFDLKQITALFFPRAGASPTQRQAVAAVLPRCTFTMSPDKRSGQKWRTMLPSDDCRSFERIDVLLFHSALLDATGRSGGPRWQGYPNADSRARLSTGRPGQAVSKSGR